MGALSQALHGQRVYLDSNVFIYALEGVEPWATPLREVFIAMETGQFEASTSALTLAECLVRPFALARDDLVQLYKMVFSARQGLEIAPVQSEVLVTAARLRAQLGLKLPDAIHAATAQVMGCTALLTNDTGFKRLPGVMRLAEVTLFNS